MPRNIFFLDGTILLFFLYYCPILDYLEDLTLCSLASLGYAVASRIRISISNQMLTEAPSSRSAWKKNKFVACDNIMHMKLKPKPEPFSDSKPEPESISDLKLNPEP